MHHEYGIWSKADGVLHRSGMSRAEAHEWMDPAEWDGGDPSRRFEIVYRIVGDWEKSQLKDWDELNRTKSAEKTE